MLTSSQACRLLSAICKTYDKNKRHSLESCAMTTSIREYLLNDSRYSKHLASGLFVISNLKVKGRNNLCFHLVSANSGTLIPVTQAKLKNITKKSPNRRQEVLAEMREAIQYQIDEYRAQQRLLKTELIKFGFKELARELLICPLTNKFLSSGNIHVDHITGLEFIRLADAWLLTQTKYRYFKDVKKLDIESWTAFHQKNAVLQLTSAKANIKKGSSGYSSRC